MKKLLILMLVLGITSAASATMQYGIYDSTGTSAVDPMTLILGSTYVVKIGGIAADDAPMDGSMNGPTLSAADWTVVSTSNGVALPAAGDLGSIAYDGTSFFGWDYGVGSSGFGDPVVDGDWLTIDLSADALGTFQLDFANWTTIGDIEASIVGQVIPEPASMLLLGLGGLLLRRRK